MSLTIEAVEDFELDFQEVVFFPDKSSDMNEPVSKVLTAPSLCQISLISQNVTKGSLKDRGQDVASMSRHSGYSCNVLCDGHDVYGFNVAEIVCRILPKIIFSLMETKYGNTSSVSVSDELINEAFTLCQYLSCFSKDCVPSPGEKALLKIAGSSEFVTVVAPKGDEFFDVQAAKSRFQVEDSKVMSVSREFLHGQRFQGGCTCVCTILHEESGSFKAIVLGDSRVCVLPPCSSSLNKHVNTRKEINETHELFKVFAPSASEDHDEPEKSVTGTVKVQSESSDDLNSETIQQLGLVSNVHQLGNPMEHKRLTQNLRGKDILSIVRNGEKSFLLNPETNDSIEPTRGFGDLDMMGTGYTFLPEISEEIELPKGTIVCLGSDGIFDQEIWCEAEFLECLVYERDDNGLGCLNEVVDERMIKAKLRNLANNLYSEGLDRAYDSYDETQIDDISFICSILL